MASSFLHPLDHTLLRTAVLLPGRNGSVPVSQSHGFGWQGLAFSMDAWAVADRAGVDRHRVRLDLRPMDIRRSDLVAWLQRDHFGSTGLAARERNPRLWAGTDLPA